MHCHSVVSTRWYSIIPKIAWAWALSRSLMWISVDGIVCCNQTGMMVAKFNCIFVMPIGFLMNQLITFVKCEELQTTALQRSWAGCCWWGHFCCKEQLTQNLITLSIQINLLIDYCRHRRLCPLTKFTFFLIVVLELIWVSGYNSFVETWTSKCNWLQNFSETFLTHYCPCMN